MIPFEGRGYIDYPTPPHPTLPTPSLMSIYNTLVCCLSGKELKKVGGGEGGGSGSMCWWISDLFCQNVDNLCAICNLFITSVSPPTVQLNVL